MIYLHIQQIQAFIGSCWTPDAWCNYNIRSAVHVETNALQSTKRDQNSVAAFFPWTQMLYFPVWCWAHTFGGFIRALQP